MLEYSLDWLETKVLPYFFWDATQIQGSENNYLALLYHHLLFSGLAATQVCREMYTTGIKNRPDLVIFSPEIKGKFSFYTNGDPKCDNTPLKKKFIKCLIEMKGGAHGTNQSLNKFQDLLKDIKKLEDWKQEFVNGDYIFIAFNLSGFGRAIKQEKLFDIATLCSESNVHFVYFLQGKQHFSIWNPKNEVRNVSIKSRDCATTNND